jgi:hypothetical protein
MSTGSLYGTRTPWGQGMHLRAWLRRQGPAGGKPRARRGPHDSGARRRRRLQHAAPRGQHGIRGQHSVRGQHGIHGLDAGRGRGGRRGRGRPGGGGGRPGGAAVGLRARMHGEAQGAACGVLVHVMLTEWLDVRAELPAHTRAWLCLALLAYKRARQRLQLFSERVTFWHACAYVHALTALAVPVLDDTCK